jgi:hypothetical protein
MPRRSMGYTPFSTLSWTSPDPMSTKIPWEIIGTLLPTTVTILRTCLISALLTKLKRTDGTYDPNLNRSITNNNNCWIERYKNFRMYALAARLRSAELPKSSIESIRVRYLANKMNSINQTMVYHITSIYCINAGLSAILL